MGGGAGTIRFGPWFGSCGCCRPPSEAEQRLVNAASAAFSALLPGLEPFSHTFASSDSQSFGTLKAPLWKTPGRRRPSSTFSTCGRNTVQRRRRPPPQPPLALQTHRSQSHTRGIRTYSSTLAGVRLLTLWLRGCGGALASALKQPYPSGSGPRGSHGTKATNRSAHVLLYRPTCTVCARHLTRA